MFPKNYMLRITLILIFNSLNIFLFSQSNRIHYNNLLSKADFYYVSQDYEESLKLLDSASKLYNSSTVNYLKAKDYYSLENFSNSLVFVNQAITLDDDNVYYYKLLFKIQQKLYLFQQAEYSIDKIISLSDNYYDFIEIASYYDSLEQFQKSVNVLNLANKKFGNDLQLQLNLFYEYQKYDSLSAFNIAKNLINTYQDVFLIDYIANFYLYENQLDSLKLFLNSLTDISNRSIVGLYKSLYYAKLFKNTSDSLYLDSTKFFIDKNFKSVDNQDLYTFLKKYENFYNPLTLSSVYDLIVNKFISSSQTEYLYFFSNVYSKYHRYCNQMKLLEIALSKPPYKLAYASKLASLYVRFSQWQKLDSLSTFYIQLYPANAIPLLYKSIAVLNSDNVQDALSYLSLGNSLTFDDTLMKAYFSFFTALYYYEVNDDDNFEFYKNQTNEFISYDTRLPIFFVTYLSQLNILNQWSFEIVDKLIFASDTTLSPSLSYAYSLVLFNKKDYATSLKYVDDAINTSQYPNFLYYFHKYKILKALNNPDAEHFYHLSVIYGNTCLKN